jgi:S1-C subfamily serine protease
MIPRQQLQAIADAVQGIPVWGCLAGSTAAEAGVRYGDIVLEVNGLRTITIDDYLAGRKLRSDGIALRLFRDGSELTLFVELRPMKPEQGWEMMLELIAEGRFVSTAPPPESPKTPPS